MAKKKKIPEIAVDTFLTDKKAITGILNQRNAYLVAIDPGQKGGVSIRSINTGYVTIHSIENQSTSSLFKLMSPGVGQAFFFVIEHVHAMPMQGIVSAFNFGRAYERVMAIADIHSKGDYFFIHSVQPREWQKYFQEKYNLELPTGKENQAKRKQELLSAAIKEGLSVTIADLDIADAYLIGQWAFHKITEL
jgi:hypothetical protein